MDVATAVQGWLEPRAEEMAALLAELVSLDTENPPGRGLGRSTEEDHPMAQVLAASVAQVENVAPAFELCPGILETRWYAQLGVPAFGYGAGRLDVSHGPGEYIDEAAMRRCAAVYALFAARALR